MGSVDSLCNELLLMLVVVIIINTNKYIVPRHFK